MAEPSNAPLESDQDAIEIQRAAIAGEIHDSLIPYLFATRMRLESLVARLQGPVEVADDSSADVSHTITEVSKAIETLHTAMSACRHLTSELYPPDLTTASWSEHLLAAFDRAGGPANSRLVVSGDFDSMDSNQAHRIAARRIAQESIRNAVRHGHATTVHVSVTTGDEGRVRLSIHDDGSGFSTASPGLGFGLRIMRSRASIVQASFTVESKLGGPTTVTVIFNRQDAVAAD